MKKGEEWQKFLASAIDQSFDGIAIADLEYKLMYANPAWAMMHGYTSSEELIGKSIEIFHNREQMEKDVKPFIRVVKEKGKNTDEMQHVRKDGTQFITLMTTTLLKDTQERPLALLGIIKDVSDRKKVENELYENEYLLSESQKIAQIGSWSMWFKDKTEKINWTDEMYKIYGVDPSSFTPDIPSFLNLIHPEDLPLMQTWIDECIAGKQPGELIFRTLRADGTIRFISGQGDLIYDIAGPPMGIAGTAQDITKRVQTHEQLRESKLRYQDLVENSIDWVWEVDTEGRYTYVSPRIRDLLGYEPEEVMHKTPFDLMPPEEAKRVRKLFLTAVALHEPMDSVENTNLHKDGHPVVLETNGLPFYDATGAFCGYRGIDRDITERKQTENKLFEQRAKLEETNVALRVILRESEITKKELEQNVLANIEDLLLPYLAELETRLLAEEQQFFLKIIKANIHEITSSFARKLKLESDDLTPREIQVAHFIKQGRTNKEIARLLNITANGVDFHRRNLRQKLNIKNKKQNLRDHLLSYVV